MANTHTEEPTPCCGKTPSYFVRETPAGMKCHVLVCGQCGAKITALSKGMAVKKWNRRDRLLQWKD